MTNKDRNLITGLFIGTWAMIMITGDYPISSLVAMAFSIFFLIKS